jgi:prepilin peptidase CpaA
MLLAVGAAVLVLAVLLVPFSRRVLGGGDVKLMVACTVWTGFHKLPSFLLATALVGGLVALVVAAVALRAPAMAVDRAAPLPNSVGRPELRARLYAARVPYSIAIAVGVVIALHWRMR